MTTQRAEHQKTVVLERRPIIDNEHVTVVAPGITKYDDGEERLGSFQRCLEEGVTVSTDYIGCTYMPH